MGRINLIEYYSMEKFKLKLLIIILLLLIFSLFINGKYMSYIAYLKDNIKLSQLLLQSEDINDKIKDSRELDGDNLKSEEDLSVLGEIDEHYQRKKDMNNNIYKEILVNIPQNINIEEIIFMNGQVTVVGTSINSFLPINFVNNLERCKDFIRPNLDEISKENLIRFKISFAIENLELIKVEAEE